MNTSLHPCFDGVVITDEGAPDDLAITSEGLTTAAYEGDARIGYIHHQETGPDEVVIHHLWVHVEHRRRGVATRLMDEVADLYAHDALFRTSEFSEEGQQFADAYEARTGVWIHDDSADWPPIGWLEEE